MAARHQVFGQAVWPEPGPRRRERSKIAPYDLRELDAGCEVELEHTTDRFKACKIARDHLHEDPRYYTKLCSIWPHERGCQHVRRPFPWPWLLMITGLGVVAFTVAKTRA